MTRRHSRRGATATSPSRSTRCRWDRGSAGTWKTGLPASEWLLVLWIARKLKIGQADAANDDLVGANADRRLVSHCAPVGDEIILLHAVARYTQSTHHHAVPVERSRAGEEYDPGLIIIGSLVALRARIGGIEVI